MSENNDITIPHNFNLDTLVDTLLSRNQDIHVIDTS